MNSIIVPDTGVRLVDGSIVILARFPGVKWIVHNGWYTFQNQQCMGWYFCSIPTQTILPVTNEDLMCIIVVDDQACPYPPPCPPYPPYPGPCPPPSPSLDTRAWITVQTLAERDWLSHMYIPDGKIIRVNETDSGPAYYRWNAKYRVWDVETFGLGDTISNMSNTITNIQNDIINISASVEWKYM